MMNNKSVLITGASGGIGSACARLFAIKGCKVILHYNTGYDNISFLEKLLKDNNYDYSTVQADLNNKNDIKKMSETVGKVDILINNAGISCSGLITDMSDEMIDSVITTNLTSAILLTKYLIPKMVRNNFGRIINISSMWGICGASCEAAYSASKAGLIGFTKALAKELSGSGITVNCVAPGAVKTKMLSEYSHEELDNFSEQIPLNRLAEPQEIAETVYFLASEKADYYTGQILSPNGGLVI